MSTFWLWPRCSQGKFLNMRIKLLLTGILFEFFSSILKHQYIELHFVFLCFCRVVPRCFEIIQQCENTCIHMDHECMSVLNVARWESLKLLLLFFWNPLESSLILLGFMWLLWCFHSWESILLKFLLIWTEDTCTVNPLLTTSLSNKPSLFRGTKLWSPPPSLFHTIKLINERLYWKSNTYMGWSKITYSRFPSE